MTKKSTFTATKFGMSITLLSLTALVVCRVLRPQVLDRNVWSLFQPKMMKTTAGAAAAADNVTGVPRSAVVPFTVDEFLYIMGDDAKNDTAENQTTSTFERRPNAMTTPSFVHRMTGDERYLDYIRTHIARPVPNKPSNVTGIAATHLTDVVDSALSRRRNGFFVECGAFDGETVSNSLFFETHRNWTGLLIEANRRLYKQVLQKNRKAFVFGGCLSPVPRPAVLRFKSAGGQGGLEEQLTKSLSRHIDLVKSFESLDNVQCFPLSDLLAALGVSRVDYLSLDVQGAEPSILRTIDFYKLRIDVVVVEVFDDDLAIKHKLSYRMKKFFDKTKLYRLVMQTPVDMIFQRIDLDAPPGR